MEVNPFEFLFPDPSSIMPGPMDAIYVGNLPGSSPQTQLYYVEQNNTLNANASATFRILRMSLEYRPVTAPKIYTVLDWTEGTATSMTIDSVHLVRIGG